jgi:hypothetical protein
MYAQIKDQIYVLCEEVASVERHQVKETFACNFYELKTRITFDGSKIILKNGKEILVDEVMPDEIIKKLKLNTEADHAE